MPFAGQIAPEGVIQAAGSEDLEGVKEYQRQELLPTLRSGQLRRRRKALVRIVARDLAAGLVALDGWRAMLRRGAW